MFAPLKRIATSNLLFASNATAFVIWLDTLNCWLNVPFAVARNFTANSPGVASAEVVIALLKIPKFSIVCFAPGITSSTSRLRKFRVNWYADTCSAALKFTTNSSPATTFRSATSNNRVPAVRSSLLVKVFGVAVPSTSPTFTPTKSPFRMLFWMAAICRFSRITSANGLSLFVNCWLASTKRQLLLFGSAVYVPRINFLNSTISKVVTVPDLFASAAINL